MLRRGSVWEEWGSMGGEVLWLDFDYLLLCIILLVFLIGC